MSKRPRKYPSRRERSYAGWKGIQAIRRLIDCFDHPETSEDVDMLLNQYVFPFFFVHDRVLKNAERQFDIAPANEVLERLHRAEPVSRDDLQLLYDDGKRLLNRAVDVTDEATWLQATKDMEIYGHIHGWEFQGIGEAPPVSRQTH